MKRENLYRDMRAGYDKLASRLTGGDTEDKPEHSPEKIQWAKQEGFKPVYNPNSDQISWMPEPKATYQQPNTNRMQGSMSPERLAEVFPAFGYKAKEIDPLLTQIAQAAIDGNITQQRAMELVFQLATDTEGDAWKQKGGNSANATATDFDSALKQTTTTKRIAGE